MPRLKTWILTDLAADTWVDSFHITSDDFPQIPVRPPDRGRGASHHGAPGTWRIEKRTLRGGRRDGVDLIELDNGAFSFSILPTRGMSLWRGHYHGLHLGWRAPVQGPVHPRHVNLLDRGGLGWLDGFDEWIVRCGLSSNGPPGFDPPPLTKGGQGGSEFLPLHGRIANLPAHFVEVQVDLDPPHELRVTGQVDEVTLFFSTLRLTTTYITTPGSNLLVIQDVIENLRHAPAELELLYHCQFGSPFLEEGSRVRVPIRELAPRNEHAAKGMASLDTYLGPTPGFAEQVYFYDLHADAAGQTLALLHNRAADSGVALRFNKSDLPRFIVWKNTAAMADGYVTGLEPATNFPNFKAFEREQGRVITLPPGGRHVATLAVEVLDSPTDVASAAGEIAALQAVGPPRYHDQPRPDWCS
jgi:hypothetical protein